MMKYEDILKLTLTKFLPSASHVKALEPLFVQTLFVTLPLWLVTHFSTYYLEQINASTFLAGLMTIAGLVSCILYLLIGPYVLSSIQLATGHKQIPSGVIQAYQQPVAGSVTRTLFVLCLVLIGASLLALLPYGLGQYLIAMGSSSNLFWVFTGATLLIGAGMIMILLARLLPSVVYAGLGEKMKLSEAFSRSYGHAAAVLLILLVSSVPFYLANWLFIGALDNLITASGNLFFIHLVIVVKAVVASALGLANLYVLWASLASYMKQIGMVK